MLIGIYKTLKLIKNKQKVKHCTLLRIAAVYMEIKQLFLLVLLHFLTTYCRKIIRNNKVCSFYTI